MKESVDGDWKITKWDTFFAISSQTRPVRPNRRCYLIHCIEYVHPPWKDVLIVDEGVCGWRFQICGILNVFNYWERTSVDIRKRIVQLDSRHQIGLWTISTEIFIALGSWFSGGDIINWCCGVFQSRLISHFKVRCPAQDFSDFRLLDTVCMTLVCSHGIFDAQLHGARFHCIWMVGDVQGFIERIC